MGKLRRSEALVWAAPAVGAAASAYALWHHLSVHVLGRTDAPCNLSDLVNCDRVASSRFSEIAGLPLGVFGLGYFAACLALLIHERRRGGDDAGAAHAALTIAGVASVVVLAAISFGVIGAACLVCIVVYLATLVQAGAAWRLRHERRPYERRTMRRYAQGGWPGAAALALVAVAYAMAERPLAESLLAAARAAATASEDLAKLVSSDVVPELADSTRLASDFPLGRVSAPVVLVEFVDFACPNCAVFARIANTLAHEFRDDLLIVTKQFPMDAACFPVAIAGMHAHACLAAGFALCSGDHGRYWDFYRTALAKQWDLSPEALRTWAGDLGLSPDDVDTCARAPATVAKIADHIALGRRLGLTSTPGVFLNGRRYVGPSSYAGYRSAVQLLLDASRR